MRSACQWLAAALLVTGCGGAPRGAPSGSTSGSAAQVADSVEGAHAAPVVQVGRMTADGARRFLASHPEALILDVRNPDEWDDQYGHIEGARQIPLPELAARADEIVAWKDRPVMLVCRSGVRSQTAAEMLAGMGYRKVINLEGGMVAWRESEPKP
jgi:rhodanese-related sulfurtransferase